MATKKRCLVGGCFFKIKRGTSTSRLRHYGFCKQHAETHEAQWEKCNGEAHKPGVDQDHCGVCMPWWGEYPIAVLKKAQS